MSTRRNARRHRGKHKPYRSVPKTAVTRLHDRRQAERDALIPDPAVRNVLEHWRSRFDKPLFVYFIQADDGPVKIGKAQDPIGRLRELQCGNPRQLFIRALLLANVDLEASLHLTWGRECHVRGEWFGGGLEEVIIGLAKRAADEQILSAVQGVLNLDLIIDLASHMVTPWALKESG